MKSEFVLGLTLFMPFYIFVESLSNFIQVERRKWDETDHHCIDCVIDGSYASEGYPLGERLRTELYLITPFLRCPRSCIKSVCRLCEKKNGTSMKKPVPCPKELRWLTDRSWSGEANPGQMSSGGRRGTLFDNLAAEGLSWDQITIPKKRCG